MRWWWEKGELKKKDLQETLRLKFDVKDPKSVENEFLGFAKGKLYGMPKDIKKRITLTDGTTIFIRSDEWNPKIFIEKPYEVAKVEEKKKRKIRESIVTYPAPVLCCHTFLPSAGNYYSNAVPELFLVMPYFNNIKYVIKPKETTEPSDELYETYIPYLGGEIYGVYMGKCELKRDDTMVPLNTELPRNERNKVEIKELTNISDVNLAQSDLKWDSSGTSNYTYVPSEDAVDREVIWTSSLQSRIIEFGTSVESYSFYNEGHSWGILTGSIWVQYWGTALSSGKKGDMTSCKIITNPQISKNFQSKQDVYMYISRTKTRDNFQSSPTVSASGFEMDTINDVPEYVEYFLKVYTPNYTKNIKIWVLNKICWEEDTLYRVDVKVYDYKGEPVILLSWMPHFIGPNSTPDPNTDKIRYMMIWKNEVYESEWYPMIGYIDYPHIVYTKGDQTYYCDGYMRLVEVEEKTIIEEEDYGV